jgi:hypothetical protein
MRIWIAIVAVMISACAPVSQAQTPKAQKSTDSTRPVDFTVLGFTHDKQDATIAYVAYRIKVSTTKPIEQVDLVCKETDSGGKVKEETIIWQNIVKSKRLPIENGKTYEAQATLYPAPPKAECSLKRVVFKDLTSWSAH